ncbi:MAG: hypothetical protein Q9163_004308 [Psora crenata]
MQTDTPSKEWPPEVYQWVEYVEYLENYVAGGYHPTYLGDELSQGRYRIVHKLGYGGYSTGIDQRENRYVAIKIMLADESAASSEGYFLRHLQGGDPKHPGRSYVQTLLDEFFTDGPNGRHRCLVSEPAGCSLARSKEAAVKSMFPINIARAIAAQATMGQAYIHSCGVTHADLHLHNILFQIPNFDSWTVDEVYKKFGEPIQVPNRRLDNGPLGPEVPSYSVLPANILVLADKVTDSKIKIWDFGEAFLTNPPKSLHTPPLLLPPEAVFREKVGPPVDIWTLGCTLFEILGARGLFEVFLPNEDNLLAEMVSTFGKLPSRWWDRWQKRPDYFLEDGSWNPEPPFMSPISRPLRQRLWDMGRGETPEQCDFSPEEFADLENLLAKMLMYEPCDRITADEAMRSDYMRRWGCPAINAI